jgi:hypothetical protein
MLSLFDSGVCLMGMAEKVLALIAAGVCLLMLLRLFLGDARRARLDRAALRWARIVQRRAVAIYHWRATRQAKLDARAAAHAAIERARNKVSKEGNVYSPEVFKGPRKPH